MASFEITASLKGVYPVEVVTEKFSKQLFAIETDDEFSPTVVFELTGTKIGIAGDFKPGEKITVYFNVRCNKSPSGRWFTTLKAWKIEAASGKPQPATQPAAASPEEEKDDLPF